MYANLSLSWVFGKKIHSGFKYRDRASIIGEIVDSVAGDPQGKTKTSIMRSANLSLEQTNKYLDLLVVCDVLRAVRPLTVQEIARYKLTEKGFKLAHEFEMWHYILQMANKKII
jgi:predicted transcriptional regulator